MTYYRSQRTKAFHFIITLKNTKITKKKKGTLICMSWYMSGTDSHNAKNWTLQKINHLIASFAYNFYTFQGAWRQGCNLWVVTAFIWQLIFCLDKIQWICCKTHRRDGRGHIGSWDRGFPWETSGILVLHNRSTPRATSSWRTLVCCYFFLLWMAIIFK